MTDKVEAPLQVRLDDVHLRGSIATAEAMLRGIIDNNPSHDFVGHIDGARIIIKTILQALPRSVPVEEVVEDSTGTEDVAEGSVDVASD